MAKLKIELADSFDVIYSSDITEQTVIPDIYSTFELLGVKYHVVNKIYSHPMTTYSNEITGADITLVVRQYFEPTH